jgi:SAM-dependent methyltransferase
MNEQERWDRAAVNYQRVCASGLSEYNTSLLHFWQEKRMIFPACRVLDIGCGVGRYGSYLAALGCDVTLTDISGEMLRRARENMVNCKTPWTVYQCDFHEATGQEPVFSGGFDLVFSTMSPAVCDVKTLRKMSSMSRGWCFLARFSDWRQPCRDRLMRALGLEPRRLVGNLRADCESMIRAVEEAGYVPQIKEVDYNWADERTPEQMADYLCRNYFADDEDPEKLYAELLRVTGQLSGDAGVVTDDVYSKVLWIYWKISGPEA